MNESAPIWPKSLQDRGLADLGDAQLALSQGARELRQHSGLLEDFHADELAVLGSVMRLTTANAGQVLIQEGETGDWMMLILQGTVDVTKRVPHATGDGLSDKQQNEVSRLAVVRRGATLGEMSMHDGELRHASCTAIDQVQAAILTRTAVSSLIRQHPSVAAKLLVKTTQLLAQRLRNTSSQLIKALRSNQQSSLFRP